MEKNKKREFKLATFSLNNKNTVFLFTFIIAIFGIISYSTLPKELFPEVNFPTVFVQTIYPGNSPSDIEDLITRPIEKQIKSVKGVKHIKSTSVQDFSIIVVEFNYGNDIKDVLNDVKDAVDKSKQDLPDDLILEPTVSDIDFSEFPVININLSGDYNADELKEYAENLQDKIETIDEISKVNITGLDDREIQININPNKLDALEISFRDIENAIVYENMTISGGDLKLGDTRRSVRIVGQYSDLDQIKNTIIKHQDGHIVYLKDVAEVVDGYAESKNFARLNGKNVVSLQVIKKSGENLLNAVDNVFAKIKTAKEKNYLPEELTVTYTNDQSKTIRSQLNNLLNSMILGFFFVVLVLYLFLGFRNSLLVGLTIPMSMLLSFVVIGILGYTINMIILFSLILALGMLVDNAIVVVENIYRYISQGYSVRDAAKFATGEIAVPIITSTITTLAAFFPLIFWDSMVGEFMKLLPITLIIVLISSLFVALVLTPLFASVFIKKDIVDEKINKKKNYRALLILSIIASIGYIFKLYFVANLIMVFVFFGFINTLFLFRLAKWFKDVFLTKLENWYLRLVKFSLRGRNPIYFLSGVVFLLILSIAFYFVRRPKIEFFPINEPSYINIAATLAEGTDVTATDSVTKIIQKKVKQLIIPYEQYVESVQTTVGKGAHSEQEMAIGDTPNKGLITIKFIDKEYRNEINTSSISKQLSDSLLNKYPGVEVLIQKNKMGPPTGEPINMEITGDDLDKLVSISDSIQNIIDKSCIGGIQDLKLDITLGKPELLVSIDRNRALRYGLSTAQIASTIRTSLFGKEISKYKEGEDQYPIQLRFGEKYRYNLASLMDQKITFRNNRGRIIQVPISSVAKVVFNSSYGSIKRNDLKRTITLHSDVVEGYNANQVNALIKNAMQSYNLPDNYEISYTGEQQEQAESSSFLARAMLIALSLILIILVTQFNSIVKPFIIMTSVILSTIGVFSGLATFNMDFVVIMTGIGLISLAGVVVNNAIVLIDYIDVLKLERKRKIGIDDEADLPLEDIKECIVMAGKTRLRPVLLTAITTILGLLPMAVGMNINFLTMLSEFDAHLYFGGDNAGFWGPMAWTVIFGLTFATFLTLVIVPTLYLIGNKLKLKLVNAKLKKKVF
ncbi:MAG: efflux RND transporter permease subunit [Bacteroidetes bacterium]|nr:efflux RND transporter permease subunit [Bacteroidota bacterium]